MVEVYPARCSPIWHKSDISGRLLNVMTPVTLASDGMYMLLMLGRALKVSAPLTFVRTGKETDVICDVTSCSAPTETRVGSEIVERMSVPD